MEKEVTNNELAKSIKDLTGLVESLAISTANGFNAVNSEITNIRKDLQDFKGEVHERFNTLESKQDERFNKLEDKNRIIYTAFEKDLNIKLAN